MDSHRRIEQHFGKRELTFEKPKPLETPVKEFKSYLPTAHKAASEYESVPRGNGDSKSTAVDKTRTKAYEALKDSIQILSLTMDCIEDARSVWWNEPAKKEQRGRLLEEGDSIKLGRMNAVNNACVQMIGDVRGALGRFVRWGMGMNGGVGGLESRGSS